MNTLLAFVTVLFGAGLAGWATLALSVTLKDAISRWALSGSVAFAAFVISWMFFFYRGSVFPAADSSIFEERSSYLIAFSDNMGAKQQTPLFSVEVDVPDAIKINQEVALDLSINAPTAIFGTPNYETLLESGSEVQGRTLQPCPGPGATLNDPNRTLCATGVVGLPVRWFVRSDKTGRYFVTIQLPQEVKTELAARKTTWSGTIKSNGEDPNAKRKKGSGSVSFRHDQENPVLLSAAAPLHQDADIEIDMRSVRITLPLQFETTLGVSASTYGLLTDGGAILSALLGGGWIWHLISWFKERGSPRRRRKKRKKGT